VLSRLFFTRGATPSRQSSLALGERYWTRSKKSEAASVGGLVLVGTRPVAWRQTSPSCRSCCAGDEYSVSMMPAESFPQTNSAARITTRCCLFAATIAGNTTNGARNSTQSRFGEFRGWAYLPAKNAELSISRWPRNGRPWSIRAVKCVTSPSLGWSRVAGCIINARMIPLAQRPHCEAIDTSCLPDFAEHLNAGRGAV